MSGAASAAPVLGIENLFDWQRREVDILVASTRRLIAAAPGAGKTITTLMSIAKRREAGKARRVLLVAPRVILDTVWSQEAARWRETCGLTFDMAHRHSNIARDQIWFESTGSIVTCTPDLVLKFVETAKARKSLPVDLVVVDESQLFKNPKGARSGALQALAKIRDVWLLSGTPTPQGAIDAWVPGRVTQPDNAWFDPNFYRWRETHFEQASQYSWRPKQGTAARVNKELAKAGSAITLRAGGSGVPKALYGSEPHEFSANHIERIRSFIADGKLRLPGETIDCGTDGAFLTKLRQLTTGFVYNTNGAAVWFDDARVDASIDLVQRVDGPALVAIQHRTETDALRAAAIKAGMRVAVIDGTVPAGDRPHIIDAWNRDAYDMLLGHPAAMGHGVNLQHGSAKTIIWFSPIFDYAAFQQFNARLIRSGQSEIVSVVSMRAPVGIDEACGEAIRRKGASESELIEFLGRGR